MSKGREYLEALLIALIFLNFANTFVLQTFYIPSGSMKQTLLVGDHLFVNRFIYGPSASSLERAILPGRAIERGDIVVFRSKEDPETDVVKRCVGLPGDRVEIVAKQLYINGQRVEDSAYAQHVDGHVYDPRNPRDRGRALGRLRNPGLLKRDYYPARVVPPEHFFCLGDNRDQSHDSRFWGMLPESLVMGRALVIYWSYDYGEENLGAPPEEGSALAQRAKRFGRTLVGFFTNTRWERTFRLIR